MIAAAPTLDEQLIALDGQHCIARLTVLGELRMIRVELSTSGPRSPAGNPYRITDGNGDSKTFNTGAIARIERQPDSLPILHFLPRK